MMTSEFRERSAAHLDRITVGVCVLPCLTLAPAYDEIGAGAI